MYDTWMYISANKNNQHLARMRNLQPKIHKCCTNCTLRYYLLILVLLLCSQTHTRVCIPGRTNKKGWPWKSMPWSMHVPGTQYILIPEHHAYQLVLMPALLMWRNKRCRFYPLPRRHIQHWLLLTTTFHAPQVLYNCCVRWSLWAMNLPCGDC